MGELRQTAATCISKLPKSVISTILQNEYELFNMDSSNRGLLESLLCRLIVEDHDDKETLVRDLNAAVKVARSDILSKQANAQELKLRKEAAIKMEKEAKIAEEENAARARRAAFEKRAADIRKRKENIVKRQEEIIKKRANSVRKSKEQWKMEKKVLEAHEIKIRGKRSKIRIMVRQQSTLWSNRFIQYILEEKFGVQLPRSISRAILLKSLSKSIETILDSDVKDDDECLDQFFEEACRIRLRYSKNINGSNKKDLNSATSFDANELQSRRAAAVASTQILQEEAEERIQVEALLRKRRQNRRTKVPRNDKSKLETYVKQTSPPINS